VSSERVTGQIAQQAGNMSFHIAIEISDDRLPTGLNGRPQGA
jgi:hypothetical protein